jgi:hypothetical protein
MRYQQQNRSIPFVDIVKPMGYTHTGQGKDRKLLKALDYSYPR